MLSMCLTSFRKYVGKLARFSLSDSIVTVRVTSSRNNYCNAIFSSALKNYYQKMLFISVDDGLHTTFSSAYPNRKHVDRTASGKMQTMKTITTTMSIMVILFLARHVFVFLRPAATASLWRWPRAWIMHALRASRTQRGTMERSMFWIHW